MNQMSSEPRANIEIDDARCGFVVLTENEWNQVYDILVDTGFKQEDRH